MKRCYRILFLISLAILGAITWWTWTRSKGLSPPARVAEKGGAGSSSTASQPSRTETLGANPADAALLLALAKVHSEGPTVAPLEKELREEREPEQRKAAIGQLLSHHFDRADAIRVLKIALNDPDSSVRVRAAELLFTLGSPAGKPVLLDIMRAALGSQPEAKSSAANAARILSQFREVIPADLLYPLYREFSHPSLLTTMAMQGDTRYFDFLIEALRSEEIAGNVFNLGVLGAPNGYAIAKQIFDSTSNERTKIAAAWAMFRTGGDRAALGLVLERAALGVTTPKPPELATSATIADARRAVYVTKDEAVRDFLRQAVSTPIAGVNNPSLASLFYVQRDYAFVDPIVRDVLSGHGADRGFDHNLVWRIAAARGTPEIDAAARTQSSEFHELYFNRFKDRPVEGWIWSYLSDIPMR